MKLTSLSLNIIFCNPKSKKIIKFNFYLEIALDRETNVQWLHIKEHIVK
jgi:hypothetical protein